MKAKTKPFSPATRSLIGDVGRPDLRESAGNITAKREELARQMYHSTREKLMQLGDDVQVYPAHGAGTLCGKSLSEANSSTIGAEKSSNYALQHMSEDEFVEILTADQPFIPIYFGYDVDLNKKGIPDYQSGIAGVQKLANNYKPAEGALVVDARSEKIFKKGHYKGAINIQNGGKFETWLGSIIGPDEEFYLVAASDQELDELIAKAARIGYELKIKGAFVLDAPAPKSSPPVDLNDFKANPGKYTIVDVRNRPEVKEKTIFKDAINIPLPELRERAKEIPEGRPVIVHCAGGYRSAAGSSIVEATLPNAKVLDLSEAINEFKKTSLI